MFGLSSVIRLKCSFSCSCAAIEHCCWCVICVWWRSVSSIFVKWILVKTIEIDRNLDASAWFAQSAEETWPRPPGRCRVPTIRDCTRMRADVTGSYAWRRRRGSVWPSWTLTSKAAESTDLLAQHVSATTSWYVLYHDAVYSCSERMAVVARKINIFQLFCWFYIE